MLCRPASYRAVDNIVRWLKVRRWITEFIYNSEVHVALIFFTASVKLFVSTDKLYCRYCHHGGCLLFCLMSTGIIYNIHGLTRSASVVSNLNVRFDGLNDPHICQLFDLVKSYGLDVRSTTATHRQGGTMPSPRVRTYLDRSFNRSMLAYLTIIC